MYWLRCKLRHSRLCLLFVICDQPTVSPGQKGPRQKMTTTFFVFLFCLLAGAIAAILWPRRHSSAARAFAVAAVAAAAIIAVVNARNKSKTFR